MRATFPLAAMFMLAAFDVAATDENFSRSLAPDDFAAAGLAKLSPPELVRLDALVRLYRSGAEPATAARTPAAHSAPAPSRPAAQPAAAVAARHSVERGAPDQPRVRVAPGTRVEYGTVESRIAGEFRGWEPGTVFTLDNGERWRVTGGDRYVAAPATSPAVKIVPGVMGSFWMTIDGVKPRVKVAPLLRPR